MLKNLPKSKVALEVTIPWKEMDKFLKRAAAEYSKRNPLPGFRPGKASLEAVTKKVGQDFILREALDLAIEEKYIEAVLENKLEVIGAPEVDARKKDWGEDIVFTAEVAIFPKAQVPEIKDLKIEKPKLEEAAAKDDEVEQSLEQLRKMRAKLVTVNRAAKEGDRVEVDFKLFMGGAPYEGGSSVNHPIVIGEKKFIPGFEEQLIGMKKDEKKKFEQVFPKKYHDKRIEGKKGEFAVTMKLVQEQELPALDDEFAKSLGRFETAKDLKESIKKNLSQEKKMGMINEALDKLLRQIAKKTEADIPEILVKEEKEKMYQELEMRVAQMGLGMQDYLKQIKKDRESLIKEWDEQAEERIKAGLAIKEIGKREKLEPKEEELKIKTEMLMGEMKQSGQDVSKVDPKRVENYARGLVTNEKVMTYLRQEVLDVKDPLG